MIFSAQFFNWNKIFLRKFWFFCRILPNFSAGLSNRSTCPQEHFDENFQNFKNLPSYRLYGNLSEKCSDLHENVSEGFSEHSTFPEDQSQQFFPIKFVVDSEC